MKRFRELAKKDYFFALVFALISLFALTWFHGEDFILAGDSGWPLDFERFFELTASVWDSSVAPGYNAPRQLASMFPYATYGLIASKLGIVSSVFQRLVYVVSFFISGFGFYLLARSLKLKNLGSFVSGLLYMLSPYALIVAWNPAYGLSFPFYAYLPLCLYFFRRYLVSKRGVFNKEFVEALFVLTFSFFGAALSNPVYLMLFIGLLTLTFLYTVISDVPDRKILLFKRVVTYAVVYLLLSSFWLIPSVLKTDYVSSDNVSYGLVDDYSTQYINTVYFRDGLRMLGLWTMFSKHLGDYYYTFNALWTHPIYMILSVMPLFLSIFYILKKKSKEGVLLLFLFVLALALNAGLRAPRFFENFIQPFLSIPLFSRAIRSVYLKLGFLLVIPITLLLGKQIDTQKPNSITLSVLLGLLIFSYPFFNGDLLRRDGVNMPGYSVSIPADYTEVLNEFSDTDRVLVFPIPPGYNYHLDWKNGGYIGADFMRTLTNSSLYYIGNRPLAHYFTDTLDINVLRDLSIDYVLVRKDIFANEYKDYLTDDPVQFEKIILDDSRISFEKETDNLILYSVSEKLKNPLVYVPGEDSSFEKISSYKYVLTSQNGGERIVFAEAFDPDWVAYSIDQNEERFYLDGHEVWAGYANSWDLGEHNTVFIEFRAQKNFTFGLWISTLTIISLGFLYLRRMHDDQV